MKLVVGPLYQGLASELAQNFEILQTTFKRFPDGELFFRFLEPVENEDIAILVSGYPNQNEAIVRTTLLSRTLENLGARKIIGVLPYFPYARQDKRFRSGEPISAKMVAEGLFDSGIDNILTVDVHSEEVFEEYGERFVNLKSIPVWADYLKRMEENYFLIAPDEGRVSFVEQLAQEADCDFITLSKKRSLETGEIEELGIEEKKLKKLRHTCTTAILFDDIISTGGTASKAIQKVNKFFEGTMIAAFTHGVFLSGAVSKLLRAGTNKILTADTIDTSYSQVSVAPLISKVLKDKA